GQARKSLWIETTCRSASLRAFSGQARKSLWIETDVVDEMKAEAKGSGS
ncbi:hypothetical protein CLOSYM_03733, partial [[Clostridium] symbiosum ATCC 14940]